MNSKLKLILILIILIILAVCIFSVLVNGNPHKKILIQDVDETIIQYRYSTEEIAIETASIEEVISKYNESDSFEKVYSEELPCYSVTLKLKGGVVVKLVDLHSEDSILVERVFFGKTTKYEFYDKNLLDAVKKLIKENFDLHINEVCKKYS